MDYEEFKKNTQKEIKELGYEEVLIRVCWNLTLLMNKKEKGSK